MQERFDSEMMVERARDLAKAVRKSEAYPAIIGGIAGGIAGALMAALIASRFSSPASRSAEDEDTSAAKISRPSFQARDAVQLLAVVAGLVKQAREWYAQERVKH